MSYSCAVRTDAFSSSGPFIKPLLEAGWSLGAALLVRMGVAGLILSPAVFRAIRRQPGFLRRHWKLIAGFGLMPVLGCQLFFFSAMQRMPVAVALLIQYLAPIMLVAFVWLRTRKAPSSLVLWGSAVAMRADCGSKPNGGRVKVVRWDCASATNPSRPDEKVHSDDNPTIDVGTVAKSGFSS